MTPGPMTQTLALAAAALAPTGARRRRPPRPSLDAVQRAVHVCASCHGPDGNSSKLIPRWPAQLREYTIRQLKDFRSQSARRPTSGLHVGHLGAAVR